MSTWYKTGTVAVTNGSATVTGTGTAWSANVKVGEAFRLSGGQRLYEITAVVSDTELTISPAYMDTSQTGQAYEIVPIKGFLKAAYDALQSALSTINGYISGPLAGLFGDGTAGEPSIGFESDPNTGFFRAAADQIGAATNGIRRWLLTSTAFQVDVPITGTAVVQSKTDATAGRIPTVGWMGWGEAAATPPSLTDFGSFPASGAYRWIGNATTDGPDALGWWSTVLVMKATGGDTFLAMRAQDSNNPPVTYVGRADTDGLNVQWARVPTVGADSSMEVAGGFIETHTLTIADNAAGSVTPGFDGGFAFVAAGNDGSPASNANAIFHFDVGPSNSIVSAFTGPAATLTTGVLTGTTGVDGDLTISAGADGNLYVENRTGASRKFTIHILR